MGAALIKDFLLPSDPPPYTQNKRSSSAMESHSEDECSDSDMDRNNDGKK